ncbi:heavy metal-binding domain-containing protein [Beijerinckia sp. L45]|uniref:heavy metal-binding domain-containing protein n=1 Tax=Beijerinckia sp. L45 TaxID=1641855 RepID=UPI00131E7250|nr:heavy metal-binding domain-containing protein [Beijerinckia sp. L45]
MLTSEKDAIEGARVLYRVGKIKAASAWHASGHTPMSNNWRERVLQDLIRRAEDVDADAIIGVDYEIDAVTRRDESGVELERVCATGIAVRLAIAA